MHGSSLHLPLWDKNYVIVHTWKFWLILTPCCTVRPCMQSATVVYQVEVNTIGGHGKKGRRSGKKNITTMSLKLILYSTITIFFNGAVLRRYLRDELLLTGPYTLLILLPTITQPICQLLFGGFCGITLFAIASYRIYQSLPQRFIESEGKHVFISGMCFVNILTK